MRYAPDALSNSTSTASSNLCPLDDGRPADDLAQLGVGGVVVSPDDEATDHAALRLVAGVVGAVEREVAQRGELGLDPVEP